MLFYDQDWASTGGYAHLHRDVPLYALENDQDTARESTAAFNAIVLTRASLEDFAPQFTLQECSGDADDDVFIMKRKGGCTPAPDLEVNAMLRRKDE